jgi:zinc/manganese transport system substrate-binding protein
MLCRWLKVDDGGRPVPAKRMRRTRLVGGVSLTRGLRAAMVLAAAVALTAGLAACGGSSSGDPASASSGGSAKINAVGAENEYANVIEQIGGKYVKVSAIESNPNTDPHTFEASPSVAQAVSAASLLIENGVGYDTYMEKIEAASSNSQRKFINVQKLLRLPDSTPNPHLWYKPTTMPAVAKALVTDLSALVPAHAAYFQENAKKFEESLQPWYAAIAKFKAAYAGTPVASTEPVGDYMLEAVGTKNMTPFTLQASIMNGTDPAPQNVTLQNGLFSGHQVKVFVYNQQVTDTLTNSFRELALKEGIPVVGVYETMPVPGYDYQSWMLAEVQALEKAVTEKVSTQKLVP